MCLYIYTYVHMLFTTFTCGICNIRVGGKVFTRGGDYTSTPVAAGACTPRNEGIVAAGK